MGSNTNHHQQATEENRQAIMLFAIVALFFVCHILRNFLSLHEAMTFEEKKLDYFHGCGGVPLWILVIGEYIQSSAQVFNIWLLNFYVWTPRGQTEASGTLTKKSYFVCQIMHDNS